jgi:hypothetical protein
LIRKQWPRPTLRPTLRIDWLLLRPSQKYWKRRSEEVV